MGHEQQTTFTHDEVMEVVCPMCGSSQRTSLMTEWGSIGVVRCAECDLIYISPRLLEPEKFYWSRKEQYIEEARLIFSGERPHHRDANYLADLRIIERFQPTGKFLDIGSNMGLFLRKAMHRGWELYGVEPSPTVSDISREQFNLNICTGFLHDAQFEDNMFNVVTMTDVFEHVPEPRQMLQEIHRILRPGGILFVKVPNGKFNQAKQWAYQRFLHRWRFAKDVFVDIYDSREHIVHYTQQSLTRMLNVEGFSVEMTGIPRPIQTPTWRALVGRYYQYPTPWFVDWRNKAARMALYGLSLAEMACTGGRIGWAASSITAVARKAA